MAETHDFERGAFVPNAVEASVLDRVSEGVFGLDREWRYTYLNQAAAEMVGRTPEGLTGRIIWDEFPEAVGSTFDQMYREALYRQEVVEFEDFYEPLGKWFDVKIYPSYGGLTIIFRDATARRKSRETMTRMSRRLDEAPCAILGVGPDGVVLYANLVATAQLGPRDETPVGHPFAEVAGDAARDAAVDLLARAAGGRVAIADLDMAAGDGSTRRVRLVASGILDDADRLEEVVIIIADLSVEAD
jgi:PAS domain S-box-containing protein